MDLITRRRLPTVWIAACGRGGSESRSGRSGNANAIVTRDFTNPYRAALRNGALAEGKQQGVTVDVQASESETDATGANAKPSTPTGQTHNCFGVVPFNVTNVITPLVPVAQKNFRF